MLGALGGLQTILIYTAAAVLGAVILGVGRAAMKLIQSRQAERRNDDDDQKNLSEFFFGSEKNQRTGTPAKEGWTTKVDRSLNDLAAGLARTERAVQQILGEVKEDMNGDHNLRGIVKRGAEAAGAEVVKTNKERQRVQHRDAEQDAD